MSNGKIDLEVSKGEGISAYVYLPDHPGPGQFGVVFKQVSLKELYPNYEGAALYFDFDKDNRLIGIDITV